MRTSGFDPILAEIIGRRLRIVTVFVIFFIAILISRLWFLQIIKGPMYRVKSENNRIHLQSIPPFRGLIMDRNGELLVDNRPSYDLYVIPEDIKDPEELLLKLRPLISLDPAQSEGFLKKIKTGRSFNPVLLKKNMSREELAVIEVNRFNLPGVFPEPSSQRNYIYDTFASHIIGYLGEIDERQLKSGKYMRNRQGDLIGQYGIEGIWQNELNGRSGGRQVEVDAVGRKLRTISEKPPVPGYNIYLTIDKGLQLIAEESLKGKTGAIVALDPNNGEVLALASSPVFEPKKFVTGIKQEEWNTLRTSKESPLQNRAIRGQYPPGSIYKIIVALAGLEEGVIDPKEELYCPGYYKLGDHTFGCWKKGGHGSVNLHNAIRESCDVYFYRTGRKLGIDKIAHYSRMFGLGRKIGIDLDNEEAGLIPDSNWKKRRFGVAWQQGETLSCAIGQSYVNVTPVQMASMISIVFNGGLIYKPRVVKMVVSDESKIIQIAPEQPEKIDIKSENIEIVKQALIAVVNDPKGTGKNARVNGVTVAGKTGTAQVINLKKAKSLTIEGEIPEEYKDHGWFVAIAPAVDPKIAIAVLIEHGESGSGAAAPVAGKLISHYLKK
ncbi:MAG: penicillin-binding protein 2 [Deltaproteobacteria bacterium]|nr:penicillin-binding protein 2 [Deltaproteobacteria bacterium]